MENFRYEVSFENITAQVSHTIFLQHLKKNTKKMVFQTFKTWFLDAEASLVESNWCFFSFLLQGELCFTI